MGVLYAKVAGAWEPVLSGALDLTAADARYVNVSGDAMTGSLLVDKAGAAIPTDYMLRVGRVGTTSMWFDQNDIQVYGTDGTTPGTLGLNSQGGTVNVGVGSALSTVNINTGTGGGPVNIGTGGPGQIIIGQQAGADNITLRGNNTYIPDPAYLGFGSATRSCISLYGGHAYAIGVQASGLYARSGGAHYWYTGGVHSDTQGSPGSGGIRQMGFEGMRLKVGDWTNGANNVGDPLRLFGPNPGGCNIGFWNGAETNARSGYVGFANDTQLFLRNERNSTEICIWNNVSQPIRFGTAGAERAQIDLNGHVLISKTDAVTAGTQGAWYHPGNGWWYLGSTTAQQPMTIYDKFGGGVASGHDYIHFRNNNSTIGSIQRSGTTAAVVYNTTSDYRLKDDRGFITNALDRLNMLKPRRIHWKGAPEAEVVDGFFAHEVAVAVPESVTGTKDAVATEADVEDLLAPAVGAIIPQMLDTSMLVPLLVAAVQELTAQVAELRGAA